ncbi:MAG: rod shape-determining protein MreC [Chitinophagaceae bacterium]|nr:MAG: rod shape-determining protein MreC [Chitinophagaceae bacterium]
MRNIFLFIRRYFNFLFFVVLQIVALSFLFRYNKFHEAAFMGIANETTGMVGARFNSVEYYFNLKKTNDSLVKENADLRNSLAVNFENPDTTQRVVADTIPYDTLGHYRKYMWRPAKVVSNTSTLQNNYLTIERGLNQGVRKDMGVISPTGIVGTVVDVSANYAVVMSLLHRQSRVSARMKKTGETGTIQWDGESPFFLTLINVPKSAPVAIGDSVITSQYSYLFPQGIMVGTVAAIVEDKTSNFYTMKVKPATNFSSVEYVTVAENLMKDEQKKLEEASRKNQ